MQDVVASSNAMDEGQDDEVEARPDFPALTPHAASGGKSEFRKVPAPPHRLTPLQQQWQDLITPLVTHMKLDVRYNTRSRNVELKTSSHTQDLGAVQKGEDYVKAFMLGFELKDAIALLRLDDLYIDSFEIDDVKTLHGDHLSRAIGRMVGKDGQTRFAIENLTRTRIVIADKKVHILGSFTNIKIARDALVSLVLGSPPGKVYAKLKTIASRMHQRF